MANTKKAKSNPEPLPPAEVDEQPHPEPQPPAVDLVELPKGAWPVLRATVLALPISSYAAVSPKMSAQEFASFVLDVAEGRVQPPPADPPERAGP